jgi:putative membrane protein
MLAALTDAAGLGAGIIGLLIWSVLAFIGTTIAVARRRVAHSRDLLAASPVPA